MREHPLRSILSRALRGRADSSEVELVYLHRGAPENQVRIRVSTISHLGKGSFMLSDGETQIPFHRVLYVTDLRSKTILWEKRKPLHASSAGRETATCLASQPSAEGGFGSRRPAQRPSHSSQCAA